MSQPTKQPSHHHKFNFQIGLKRLRDWPACISLQKQAEDSAVRERVEGDLAVFLGQAASISQQFIDLL